MAEQKAVRPTAYLLPADFEIIMKLLPRAQIVVGDVPQIYGTLQRIEAAFKTRSRFIQEVPNDE